MLIAWVPNKIKLVNVETLHLPNAGVVDCWEESSVHANHTFAMFALEKRKSTFYRN